MSRQKSTPQMAMAAEHFDHFCSAGSMRQILALHRAMCDVMNVKPSRLPDFYPKVKSMLERSWKAQALFKKFDTRANHKVYAKGMACPNTRVLIIGAGPCGLRAAIECQLLGAKVVVVEKRDRMSRNNVLHLWPLVIHDLRALGAKKFYGKFCAGAIDHISIRQLQCILLKVCLLLGVEFHEGVSFEELQEPTVTDNGEVLGWRATFSPAEHVVSHYEFDTLIGADGKRNTLRGFKRKDFRGKLAIAITANFINRHSVQEASVEEISGVAFIFRQKFFKDMYADTGIDLENIVYYKDETHYFVMTAKKHSLLQKGVLKHDNPETSKLLSPENVDRDALQRYARQAAQYSTEDCLQHLDFALNHYGEPDVTLFDFTSMYAAENASMVLERNGRRLLCCLVGDSLLEPFWPTGSGCARGFLSALDAAWAVRSWGQTPSPHPIAVLMERESIYRLLAQTTPENLHRDLGAYTLDPRTRYPNLNRTAVTAHRVASFYNSDDPLPLDASATMRKRKREVETSEQALVDWMRRAVAADLGIDQTDGEALGLRWAVSPPALGALLRRYRPDLMPTELADVAAYAILTDIFDIAPMGPTRSAIRGEVSEVRMRNFLREVYHAFKGEVPHVRREINIAPEVDQSENGNHQEERRSDVNRRYKKKKSRATHVSKTLAPSMEMLIGKVGKLGLVKPCRFHGGLSATSESVGVSRRRSRSASPRKSAPAQPLRRSRSASLIQPVPCAHDTSRRTKKIQRSDYEEYPKRRGKRNDARNDSKITNLRKKWETQEQAEPSKSVPEKPHRTLRSSPWELRESLLEAKRRAKELHASKRRTAREIARFQFEKSTRLMATTPSVSTVDVDNDYSIQQYRAAAPEFGMRVKTLEKQLFNIDEGRALTRTRTATAGSGATVARLAAELSRSDKRGPPPPRAKPHDLLRSIGKIEPSDWNVQSIEKQIKENKLGRPQPKQAERVPKWDREKFEARQQRLKQASAAVEEPPGELEQVVQHINMLRRDAGRPAQGTSKVARLAEGFSKKPSAETTPQLVSLGKPWTPAAAELVATSASPCVVCNTRVFAAESVIADGLTVHRRCFRCAACRVALSAGSFLVLGSCLTCLHHSPTAITEAARAEVQASPAAACQPAESVEQETAQSGEMGERITLEASNVSAEMDEDEWTGRNFLASETSCAGGLSDDSSSEDEYTEAGSGSLESDFEEGAAGGSPKLPEEEAMQRNVDIYISESDDDEDESCDESGSSLGGSPELAAAREARRREVPPPSTHPRPHTDSSEVESEEESESETETSSATEVSTDSEFGPDESVPVKTPPAITVTGPAACPIRPAPPPPHRPPDPPEYPLSRTRSAGGLATKRALELKRRYLLGEPALTSVRRSDSTSRLDSRIESFRNNISQFQKLLNPAPSPDVPPEHPPRPTDLTIKSFIEPSKIFTNETKKEYASAVSDKAVQESRIETDSLSDDSSSSATKTGPSPPVPRVEVHDASGELVQLDSLIIVDAPPAQDICVGNVKPLKAESESSESCKDATTLALTETELSDWAADGGILDDMGLEEKPDRRLTSARNPRVLSAPKNIHDVKNITALSAHVCGRDEEPVFYSNATDYFEFADEGEDVSISTIPPRNAGYMEFVDDDDDYRQTEDRSMGFIEHASSRIDSPATQNYIECSPVEPKPPEEPVKVSPDEPMSPAVLDSETPTITERSSTFYNNDQLSQSKSSFTNLTEMSSSTADSEDTSAPLTVDATRSFTFSTPLTIVISLPFERVTDESPEVPRPLGEVASKQKELKRERQQQTEVVRRLVMERIGGTPARKSSRRARVSAPATTAAPPPPPRPPPPPPPRLVPSMSDPELMRVRRRRGIIQTVADFFNRRANARKKVWEDWECSCAVGLRLKDTGTGEFARRREHASAAHLPIHAAYCCPSVAHTMKLKQEQEPIATSPPLPPPPLSACSSE